MQLLERSPERGAGGDGPSGGRRVCFVTNLYPPEVVGGAETYVRSVAEALAARDFRVSVVTTASHADPRGSMRAPFSERRAGVDIYRVLPMNLYSPYDYREQAGWKKPLMHVIDLWNAQVYGVVRRLLVDLAPDVIHTHNFGGLSPAVFAAADGVAPVVHTLHDYRLLHLDPGMFVRGEMNPMPRLMAPFRRYTKATVASHVDHVLTPSQFMVDAHRDAGFFDDCPADVLRLGVPVDADAESVPTDPKRLLFVGQLSKPKGVDVLVDAVARIDDPELSLHVVGTGEEADALRERAAGDDRITFHGFVDAETLADHYRRAAATVVPSRWHDNSPMVIYESYARGTPVIGARMGGIPELIDDGETGFVVPPENPEALAGAIRMLLAGNAETITAAVRAKAETFTLDAHLDGLEAVYGRYSAATTRERRVRLG